MRKIVAVLLASIFMVSCATEKIVYVDRIQYVPEIVMEKCPSPPVVKPLTTTPLESLHKDSSFNDVAKAYVKTVEICQNKVEQYKEALDALQDEPK